MFIVATPRRCEVEQATSNIGGIDTSRIFILCLMQTAFSAPIAQRLPLPGIETGERGGPKGAVRSQSMHPASKVGGNRIGCALVFVGR